jgi:hypothetical protein
MGKPVRGALWLAAEGGALVYLFSQLQETRDARRAYLHAKDPSVIESKYQAYNDAYRLNWVAGGIAAGVYVLSQFDLALVTRRDVRLTLGARERIPELTASIRW